MNETVQESFKEINNSLRSMIYGDSSKFKESVENIRKRHKKLTSKIEMTKNANKSLLQTIDSSRTSRIYTDSSMHDESKEEEEDLVIENFFSMPIGKKREFHIENA